METEVIKPVVGMGATIMMYSDRVAATIIYVSPSARKIIIQKDKAKALHEGRCDSGQRWQLDRDPAGEKIEVRLNKDGKWRESGYYRTPVVVGKRIHYYDYGF